jgi:hypothetical protein
LRLADYTPIYIIQKMGPYIEGRGDKIVTDDTLLKDPIKFTASLIEFWKEIDEIIQVCFENNIKLQKSRDVSF